VTPFIFSPLWCCHRRDCMAAGSSMTEHFFNRENKAVMIISQAKRGKKTRKRVYAQ